MSASDKTTNMVVVCHIQGVFIQLLWAVRYGNCVQIDQGVIQLSVGLVLKLHPLMKRPKVITQVWNTSWLDS